MSKALPGENYCINHQGNHSHYAEDNCTVCRLRKQLTEANARVDQLEAELVELQIWHEMAENGDI